MSLFHLGAEADEEFVRDREAPLAEISWTLMGTVTKAGIIPFAGYHIAPDVSVKLAQPFQVTGWDVAGLWSQSDEETTMEQNPQTDLASQIAVALLEKWDVGKLEHAWGDSLINRADQDEIAAVVRAVLEGAVI